MTHKKNQQKDKSFDIYYVSMLADSTMAVTRQVVFLVPPYQI